MKIDNATRYAVSKFGRCSRSGFFLEGTRYKVFLSKKKTKLTITPKDGREPVLSTTVSPKSFKRRVKSSLKPEDARIFQDFTNFVLSLERKEEVNVFNGR